MKASFCQTQKNGAGVLSQAANRPVPRCSNSISTAPAATVSTRIGIVATSKGTVPVAKAVTAKPMTPRANRR